MADTGTQRRSYKGPVEFKLFPTGAAKTTAIKIGDAVWYDEANDVAVSAADFAWKTSEARTQREYARVHLGFSEEYRATTDSGNIRVSRSSATRLPCSSATVAKDDWICLEKASGNALEPQKVQTTSDRTAAIGRALSSGTSQTEILFDQATSFDGPRPSKQIQFIADPGNAGAIAVAGYDDAACELVSAAAETRTIARPSFAGQKILLQFKTDGGDIVLTPTGGVEGVATFTFADVGDWLYLIGRDENGTLEWGLLGGTPKWDSLPGAGTVTTAMLAADAVNGTKLADNAVDSEHITAGAIDAAHFAAGSVDAAAIGAGQVGTSELAADAVTGAKLADNAVDSEHITAGAIDPGHFAALSVETAAINNLGVTTGKLAAGAATPAKQAFTGFKTGMFVGRNGAGAITLTGAAVGDRVVECTEIGEAATDNVIDGGVVTSQPNTAFEGAITVVDQIQQSSVSNLTDKKYYVRLAPAAA